MTLPLMSAIGRAAVRGRVVGAVVLAFGLMIQAPRALAAVAGDPYSATVSVDATAANVLAARTLARHDGERRALAKVIARLSGAAAPSLARLSDQQISDMVTSYRVADERMSKVRYLADYTFHFAPSAVRRVMRDQGLTIGAGEAAPTIVLPVYQDAGRAVLWGDPNRWREAWRTAPAGSADSLLAPLADARDVVTIDAARALAGRPDALAAIGQQNGGGDVVVALATARRRDGALAGLDLAVARYRAGSLLGKAKRKLAINPGESEGEFLARAVSATATLIANGAASSPAAAVAAAAPSGEEARLDAVVPIDGLTDWIDLQKRLAALPAIRRVGLLSLSPRRARIEIDYVGTIATLKSGLAGIALDLRGGAAAWRIARADGAGMR